MRLVMGGLVIWLWYFDPHPEDLELMTRLLVYLLGTVDTLVIARHGSQA
ncbi:hypothetical protein [Vulcanisaeta distributa]|nr:hypothetical protein [Vulcanisaeta distributa]